MLRALGFEPRKEEINRLITDLNKNKKHPTEQPVIKTEKDDDVKIVFVDFLNIMTIKMSEQDSEREIAKAF